MRAPFTLVRWSGAGGPAIGSDGSPSAKPGDASFANKDPFFSVAAFDPNVQTITQAIAYVKGPSAYTGLKFNLFAYDETTGLWLKTVSAQAVDAEASVAVPVTIGLIPTPRYLKVAQGPSSDVLGGTIGQPTYYVQLSDTGAGAPAGQYTFCLIPLL